MDPAQAAPNLDPQEALMQLGNWMALLQRQSKASEPITWNEIVVGYDFGLLPAVEIKRWVRCHGFHGEACRALVETPDDDHFEAALWEACREATGRLPRPGGERWAQAQDRWRLALIRDAMDANLTPEALAAAVEAVWERVGCPEDMVGLWHRPAPWAGGIATLDEPALDRFLRRRDAEAMRVLV